jgi:hypothetical protein
MTENDPQREDAPLDDNPDRGTMPIRDPDFARRASDHGSDSSAEEGDGEGSEGGDDGAADEEASGAKG